MTYEKQYSHKQRDNATNESVNRKTSRINTERETHTHRVRFTELCEYYYHQTNLNSRVSITRH